MTEGSCQMKARTHEEKTAFCNDKFEMFSENFHWQTLFVLLSELSQEEIKVVGDLPF